MALSYFSETEAPRDFRVSSTESEGHYKKCVLCYTVKRNFYCAECIRSGNFVPSSMPYSDRFAEKQAKLLRLKANRRHVLDCCEKLLAPKLKQDTLLTEVKQSRDKIDLIRLAIEQRRQNIEVKKKELVELNKYNNELKQKLPRYQKRVASLGKHAQSQKLELQNKVSTYNDQAQDLAALRRLRIRQLNKYIFPVYMTYDASNSIEDMEFVGEDAEEEVPRRCQLHIVTPWINADGDIQHLQALLSCMGDGWESPLVAGARTAAALGLAAQLAALLAALLDCRQAAPLSMCEYYLPLSGPRLPRLLRRLSRALACLCRRADLQPPHSPRSPHSPHSPHSARSPHSPHSLRSPHSPRTTAPLQALHTLCLAAAADAPQLGRVESATGGESQPEWQWGGEWDSRSGSEEEDAEPEHLSWPDQEFQMEELSCTPPTPAPAPSLVTSAAASLASFWRGWTK